jgi:hypothetical protein
VVQAVAGDVRKWGDGSGSATHSSATAQSLVVQACEHANVVVTGLEQGDDGAAEMACSCGHNTLISPTSAGGLFPAATANNNGMRPPSRRRGARRRGTPEPAVPGLRNEFAGDLES